MIIVVGLRRDASLCLGRVSGCLKSNLRVLSVSSNPLPLNINPPLMLNTAILWYIVIYSHI